MYVVESTITHDKDIIIRLCLFAKCIDQLLYIIETISMFSNANSNFIHGPLGIRRLEQVYAISSLQRWRQLLAMHAHAHGIRARLQHGQNSLIPYLLPERLQG